MLSRLPLILIPLLLLPVAWNLLSFSIAHARKWGLMDRPGGRHIHGLPVAIVGGVGIISTWLFGITVFSLFSGTWAQAHGQSILVTLGCTLAIMAVGLADDRFGVTPRFRLLSELAIAGVTIFFEPGVNAFCQELAVDLGWVSYPLTWIGLVAVMNAMNLVDGMDGLAGGVFISIAAAVVFLTGAFTDAPSFQAVSTVMLLPGLLIFLYKNWNPAVAFMGDHGSLAIGYLLATAALSVRGSGGGHSSLDLVTSALLFSYPILDMMSCMVRRMRAGQPMMTGDRSHMHHRMLRLGLSVRESVGSLLFWQFAMISPVLLVQWVPLHQQPLLLIPSVAVALERIYFLIRIEKSRLRAMHISSLAVLPEPAQSRNGDREVIRTEVIVSLKPLLEAVQFEERGQFNQVVDSLRFFCERKVKGRGFVRVLPDHLVIGIFAEAESPATPQKIREEWAEALATFGKTFKLTYSTWSLPVHVRDPASVEQLVSKQAS